MKTIDNQKKIYIYENWKPKNWKQISKYQIPNNKMFLQANCKRFAKSITSVCIFVKARNGIWNTKSGKKTGRYCNNFNLNFKSFSISNININVKKLWIQKNKAIKKKYIFNNSPKIECNMQLNLIQFNQKKKNKN